MAVVALPCSLAEAPPTLLTNGSPANMSHKDAFGVEEAHAECSKDSPKNLIADGTPVMKDDKMAEGFGTVEIKDESPACEVKEKDIQLEETDGINEVEGMEVKVGTARKFDTDQSDANLFLFIFVNAVSGSHQAKEYMKLMPKTVIPYSAPCETEKSENTLKGEKVEKNASVYVYDITKGVSGDKEGLHHLKAAVDATTDPNILTRVIIAGGDGTVMWVLEEAWKHGVPNEKIVLAQVPVGTGNDFARSFGWGGNHKGSVLGRNNKALKKHVQLWCTSNVKQHDLWDVEIKTQDMGSFSFATGVYGKKGLNDALCERYYVKKSAEGMTMRRTACNYFSFGYESRVGLGMEKRRFDSFTKNILCYGLQGAAKIAWQTSPNVKDVVERCIEHLADGTTKTIFQNDPKSTEPYLRRNPAVFAFINTTTMVRGAVLWPPTRKLSCDNLPKEEADALKSRVKRLGDGNMNLMTWHYKAAFATDGLLGQIGGGALGLVGRGCRLYQGPNKMSLEFKKKEDAKYKKDGKVYMQVDGEYFVTHYPKSVSISHKTKLNCLDTLGDKELLW